MNLDISLLEATYTKHHEDLNISKVQIDKYLKEKYGDIDIFIADCICDNNLSINTDKTNPINVKYNKDEFMSILRSILGKNKINYCDVVSKSFAITPWSSIVPCHFFLENSTYELGNFNIPSIFNEKYLNIKYAFENLKSNNIACKECWISSMCSECPASILIYKKNKLYKNCENKRNRKEFIIRQIMKSEKLLLKNTY